MSVLQEERDAAAQLRRLERARKAKAKIDAQRAKQREREVEARRKWLEREGELFHRYRNLADSGFEARARDAYHGWVAHWKNVPGRSA